jgi:hypothetical protein
MVSEDIRSMSAPHKDTIPCKACQSPAEFQFSPTAGLLTTGMDKQTIDVTIGHDAARRWTRIKAEQDTRNKVRKESGNQSLIRTGKQEYRPAAVGDAKTKIG